MVYLQGCIRIIACTIRTFASRHTHKGTLASQDTHKGTLASWHIPKRAFASWHAPMGHSHYGILPREHSHHGIIACSQADIYIMTYPRGGIYIMTYIQKRKNIWGWSYIFDCFIFMCTKKEEHMLNGKLHCLQLIKKSWSICFDKNVLQEKRRGGMSLVDNKEDVGWIFDQKIIACKIILSNKIRGREITKIFRFLKI